MSDWIKLDSETLNPERDEAVDGVLVKVCLSPYDVPTAVRALRDPITDRFWIEFRYLDDEPYRESQNPTAQDNILYRIGKNSSRLLGIGLPLDKWKDQKTVSVAIALATKTPPAAPTSRKSELIRENWTVAGTAAQTAVQSFGVRNEAVLSG